MEDVKNIISNIISILDTSNYLDVAELLYDGKKSISRHIRLNEPITLEHLQDFMRSMDNSLILDLDGKVGECIKILSICIRNYTISSILE